jgi:hypothetical protein
VQLVLDVQQASPVRSAGEAPAVAGVGTTQRNGIGANGGGRVTERSAEALHALEALAVALEQNAEEERLLTHRIRELTAGREEGSSWHEALAAQGDPDTVQLMSSVLGRLSRSSGAFRRALVLALREEGVSIPAIARMFGVTHQRVSNLLRGGTGC